MIGIDAEALSAGVARPHERDRAPLGRGGAEAPDHRLRQDVGRRQVLEADAIENLLPRRQVLHQRLGGEIAFRQRVDEQPLADVAEAVGGGDLHLHARRPVGARPHHAGIDADIAGLQAMGDERTVAGAAEVGPGDAAERGQRRGRRRNADELAAGQNAHGLLPAMATRSIPAGDDRGMTTGA